MAKGGRSPQGLRSPRRPGDFAAFYAEHAERVLVYLAKRCLDPEVAVDLMAETFAEAYEHRRDFRGSSEEEAAGWLFGIARHQLFSYFRRGKAEQRAVRRLGIQLPPLEVEDQSRIEQLADLGPIRSAVSDHFERLSEEQRDAVQLRVIDEMPYPEVAERLRVSEDAARARVSRGLRQLAASLDETLLAKGAVSND
jgi:RNA polymerase sigma factor (sigma-70 family)